MTNQLVRISKQLGCTQTGQCTSESSQYTVKISQYTLHSQQAYAIATTDQQTSQCLLINQQLCIRNQQLHIRYKLHMRNRCELKLASAHQNVVSTQQKPAVYTRNQLEHVRQLASIQISYYYVVCSITTMQQLVPIY